MRDKITNEFSSGKSLTRSISKKSNTIILSKLSFIILGLTTMLFSSCVKHYEKTYEDYDLVRLKFQSDLDFSQYKTYTLADSLNIVRDTLYNGENSYPDFNIEMDENTEGEYSKQIINNVRTYLNALGLQEVVETDTSLPHLKVVITSMTLKQVSRYIWYPNDDYGAWWGNGYYNNYYTWGVYSYHSSNNGSLSIDMFDLITPIEVNEGEYQLNSIWHGTYEGIVGPTYEAYTNRVLTGIDDIFANDMAFNK